MHNISALAQLDLLLSMQSCKVFCGSGGAFSSDVNFYFSLSLQTNIIDESECVACEKHNTNL